jgi:hypothetical protein
MASFNASRTVISFVPEEAYPLLAIAAEARKVAGRKAGAAGREADSRREAGRNSLEAAIAVMEGEERGSRRGMAADRR